MQPAIAEAEQKKIDGHFANIEKYKKRVRCTSRVFMALGCIGMIASIWYQFTAKHHAMMMANFPPPPPPGHHQGKYKHHPPPPPPRPEEFEAMAPKTVSREEFDLYDSIKMLATITFFLSAKLVAFGKCGTRMTFKNNSKATHRLAKKSCLGLVLILIVTMVAFREKKHIKHIMKKVRMNHNDTMPNPHHHFEMKIIKEEEPTEPEHIVQASRNLAEVETIMVEYPESVPPMLKTQERDCFALGDTAECLMNEHCVWCGIKMVPGHEVCHSTNYALTLPVKTFKCYWDDTPIENDEDLEEAVETQDNVKPNFKDLLDAVRQPQEPKVQAEEPEKEVNTEEEPKEEDDKMKVVWGLPWKASVAKRFQSHGEEEHFGGERHHGGHGGHHGHHGKHGHGGRKHHGCHKHCYAGKLVAAGLVFAHFMSIRGLKHHQQMYETLAGKPAGGPGRKGCKKWRKHHQNKESAVVEETQPIVQQQIVVEQPEIDYSSVYDPEIQEEQDKQDFGPTIAPSTVLASNNSMI